MAAEKTGRRADALRQSVTPKRPYVPVDPTVAEAARAWTRCALRLLKSERGAPPLAAGVASVIRGEGRTTGSVALAAATAAETRAPVALLGLDCEGYGLAEAFDVRDAPDLDGVLRGTWTLEAALRVTDVPGLSVLPARASRSRMPVSPARFWSNLRLVLPDLLTEVKRDFPYVVCDLPPLFDNAEAAEITNEMDVVVLLTRAGVTPMRKLQEGLSLLDPHRLAGAVHIGEETRLPKWLTALLVE